MSSPLLELLSHLLWELRASFRCWVLAKPFVHPFIPQTSIELLTLFPGLR